MALKRLLKAAAKLLKTKQTLGAGTLSQGPKLKRGNSGPSTSVGVRRPKAKKKLVCNGEGASDKIANQFNIAAKKVLKRSSGLSNDKGSTPKKRAKLLPRRAQTLTKKRPRQMITGTTLRRATLTVTTMNGMRRRTLQMSNGITGPANKVQMGTTTNGIGIKSLRPGFSRGRSVLEGET